MAAGAAGGQQDERRIVHGRSFIGNEPSLRAKRSNPEAKKQDWIASSLTLLAMTESPSSPRGQA
jgi:hypothetical protein